MSELDLLHNLEPFIVTGASASGKTTLVESAIGIGYRHIPAHMTRLKREGEIEGVHGVFLSEEEFIERFERGEYLEPSLDFAKLHALGVYYGTPAEQVELLKNRSICSSPVSVAMARIVENLSGANWVHLVCEPDDRRERLARRGISKDEIERRMSSGDSIETPEGPVIINTTLLSTSDILDIITEGRRPQ